MKLSSWLSFAAFVMPSNLHEDVLQMDKFGLVKKKMPPVAYLDEAAGWSRELTRMKARGPGDTENAMRQIEREYGVDYWLLWRLRYRLNSLKDIGVNAYMRLQVAYRAECERQKRKLEHEIARTEAIAGSASPAVAAAKAALFEDES